MSAPQPIVIIGAGPAGLLLARYLQLHHIPCAIYERDPSADYRPQGGSLDLHDDTGLKALEKTDLMDEARGYFRLEGDAFKVANPKGELLYDENDYKAVAEVKDDGAKITGRPEIDRTDLRNILINSLEPGTIHWDHAVSSITAQTSSLYQVTFASHPPITTPYLIGADGASSLVRALLHDAKPAYSGLSMWELTIPAERMTPRLQRYIGAGSIMVLGERKGLIAQMNSGGKCKVYVSRACPEEWQAENPLPGKGKREWLKGHFEGWDEMVGEVIMAGDEENVGQRRIWQFDAGLKWESEMTGVTLMGDAAHVMSPFAGEGVNQALADALDLGRTLTRLFYPAPPPSPSLPPFPLSFLPISPPPRTLNPPLPIAPSPAALHTALRAYERRMMRRVRPYMVESKKNLEVCFGEGGAEAFVNEFRWMMVRGLARMVVEVPVQWVRGLWWADDE
ncbi:hypothetical protein IAT38_004361 [Cryptococcus sp. DSM 104549]